jgi:hypothetical protein
MVVGDRVDPVGAAVGDERGDGDRGGHAAGWVGAREPAERGVSLGRDHGGRDREGGRIAGGRRDERVPRRGLIGRVEIRSGITAGQRLDRGLRGHHGRSGSRERRAQHQPVYLGRVPYREGLGDHAAHGPAQDVRPAETEGVDEGTGLIGHGVDGQRGRQRLRLAHSGVVEDHDPVVLGQGVHEPRIPHLHGPGVAHDHDQWRSASDDPVFDRAQLGVGDPHRGHHDRGLRSRIGLRGWRRTAGGQG